MQGYQISFMTELNRRIDGRPPAEWLIHIAKELGIGGVTTFAGVEGVGADGSPAFSTVFLNWSINRSRS